MTGRRLYLVTAAMMLSLFLASIEQTVVATAMTTIVQHLGGLAMIAWVFSAYMLASTTMVPIFGKLSDIYGRRRIYLLAMAIFLTGSILSGMARSMEQLVIARAVQGLGAGGLMPLAFTIIGDIFTFEQRAKMQGWFSSVWGVSSIIGPLIGGFLVDYVGWQWIFFINIPVGLVAAGLMAVAWRDVSARTRGEVDYVGALLLSSGVVALMLALFQLRTGLLAEPALFWTLLLSAAALLTVLLWVERRVVNPILPLPLFREQLFRSATGHGFLAGFALFGSSAFVPFFVQTVLGTSATQAGATLTPQMLAWVLASVLGSRLLLRFNYRSLVLVGMTALAGGALVMTQIGASTPQWVLALGAALMGAGMGFSIPSFLIAVQTTAPRQSLGTATATVQFSRSMGGTVGVGVMGVILAARLATGLARAGMDSDHVSLSMLLDAEKGAAVAATLGPARDALAAAVQGVFIAALIASVLGWAVAASAPREHIGAHKLTTDH